MQNCIPELTVAIRKLARYNFQRTDKFLVLLQKERMTGYLYIALFMSTTMVQMLYI